MTKRTAMNKLPPGYKFTIGDYTKRSDGEWHSRFCWTLFDQNNEEVASCPWFGFDTFEIAFSDLKNYLARNV